MRTVISTHSCFTTAATWCSSRSAWIPRRRSPLGPGTTSFHLFASDSGGVIGKTYGANNPKFGLDNRNLFVVGPDGRIAYKMAPFREIDPQSYKDLAAAIDRITPKPVEGE